MLLLILFGPAVPAAPPPAAAQTEDLSIEFVGSIGGSVTAVTIDANYAYIGEGAGLTILDISNPSQPQQVARLPLPRVVEDVQIVENYAYVAMGDAGLQIVDVNEPTNPTLSGNYIPLDTSIAYTHGLYVIDTYAYLAVGNSGLQIIDVRNPNNPTLVGIYIGTGNTIGNVYVMGSYAYLAAHSGGLEIVDVSNPAMPTLVASYDVFYASDVFVTTIYAYIIDDNNLRIVDISNPTMPTTIGSTYISGHPSSLHIDGNYAYVASGSTGLQIVDISNPINPVVISDHDTPGNVMDVYVWEDHAYIIHIGDGGTFHIVDISTPTVPTLAASYELFGNALDVQVLGDYAYVAAGSAGLQIVDISNPAIPVLAGAYDTGTAMAIHVVNGYAYVAGSRGGLQIVDVSNPTMPTLAANYDTLDYALSVYVVDRYAYVVGDFEGFQVVDVENPTSPMLIASTEPITIASDVQVVGNYAYVAAGDYDEPNPAILQVIDIRNPTRPVFAGEYTVQGPGRGSGVYISGDYAYIADYNTSLQIIDISNPTNPTLVGSYRGSTEGVYVVNNYAYAAKGSTGLQVIDVNNPAAPTEVGSFDTPGTAKDVYVSGDYIYIADDQAGLQILRIGTTTGEPDIRIDPTSLSFTAAELNSVSDPQLAATVNNPDPSQIILTEDDTLILDFDLPMVDSSDVQVGQQTYQQLILPGESAIDLVGKPALPLVSRWLALPPGKNATLQILDSQSQVLEGYTIYPAQEPPTDQDTTPPDFRIDTDLYGSDVFYPQRLALLEPPAQLRGVTVTPLRIYPFQHNPVTGQLRAYSHVRVKINFVDDTDGQLAQSRTRSPYFEDAYQGLLLNYDQAVETLPVDTGLSLAADGADFLIVTAPEFAEAANTLADWRNGQGLITEVRTTSETGQTAENIQAYIQNAYDTWSPAPAFVLLLGDAEFIPPHYGIEHSSHKYTRVGTDLYYATVEGDDYFPDISIGRISVDTLEQATTFINNVIDYERNPPTDEGFYDRVAVAAYFQDDNKDGFSNRRFTQTSEEIRDYLLTQGYSIERIYTTKSNVDPTNYNRGFYGNGEPLPAALLRSNGFAWDGDGADVANAVNQGIFLLNHRDHGWIGGWGDPEFRVSDVSNLQNGNLLPMVFSINCQTGWFDNETDSEDNNTDSAAIAFAESWQRNPNGGAIGVIASTRNSYSGHNDALVKGFYDALWPDFLPYSSASARFIGPPQHMGNVMNYGKMYYATEYGASDTRQIEFEEFHYFGDPTTRLWTAPPATTQQTFTIYNDGDADLQVTDIASEHDSCWLSTTPASGATLTIPPGGSEQVIVTVNPNCAPAGTNTDRLLVTSNDPDESPYPNGVNVSLTVPAVNELIFEDAAVNADSENQDGIVNPGETVDLNILVRNLGNAIVTDTLVTLTTDSPYVTILDGEGFYSSVQGDSLDGLIDDLFRFEIDPTAPAKTVIVFTLQMTAADGTTWEDTFAMVVEPDTTPPDEPANPSPVDEAIDQTDALTLTWTGGDPDGDQVTYDVYVSTRHPLQDLAIDPEERGCTDVVTPHCNLTDLTPDTTYFWYVVTTDEHGADTSGPVWMFTTASEAPGPQLNMNLAVSALITVTVLDADGAALANEPVTFTTNYGTVLPANTLTDEQGVAAVIVAADDNPGDATVTMTADGMTESLVVRFGDVTDIPAIYLPLIQR
jgi:hypothetical protein